MGIKCANEEKPVNDHVFQQNPPKQKRCRRAIEPKPLVSDVEGVRLWGSGEREQDDRGAVARP